MIGSLERETVLDITVNVVPLGILLFFTVLHVVVRPWGSDPFPLAVTAFLTLFPLLLLAILTYVSGLVVQRDEGKGPSK